MPTASAIWPPRVNGWPFVYRSWLGQRDGQGAAAVLGIEGHARGLLEDRADLDESVGSRLPLRRGLLLL